MLDRKVFYDTLRPKINLTTSNVVGMNKVLDYAEGRGSPTNDLAYILATAWWETGQTMQPVREAFWLSESWRKKNLRYYPYYGRGLVQTTWKANYATMSKVVGVDLVDKPDLLLKWEYSLPALFIGMERGLYTGKKISNYIDRLDESDAEDLREYTNARRVVNGTDKASTIGKLALNFEKALKSGGYEPGVVSTVPAPIPPDLKPVPPAAPVKPTPAEVVGAGGVAVGAGVAAVQAGFDWWLVALIAVAAAITALIVIRAIKD